MAKLDHQAYELDLLLSAIHYRYGYDFRDYAKASLTRRVELCLQKLDLTYVSELIPKILHDTHCFNVFLKEMSVTVTDFFRNPEVFNEIRTSVFPKLQTFSRISIWHVGCATGQEVYSMAMLLDEAGLLEKSRLYATDFNSGSLAYAKKGIYSQQELQDAAEGYHKAGGQKQLSYYFHSNFGSAKICDNLKSHVTFAHHNLMQDQAFAEMQLILCRNVLIYFAEPLKNRVLNILSQSLNRHGYLVLGDKESLMFSEVHDKFQEHDAKLKIYRKKREHSVAYHP
ncbi:chemotaxis protein CheR [Saccharobesus litoralis]|uniref:Chemotaxis protein CheR n=1 Tax=Saccharobesus litoralis TaxID=2172099 RepID=A0A2S0VLG8_9ALTE|nr:protein-glutamate O-methyltransferase CheR [Saccharobesus litoralis]AWB65035.1 chemotaxis protein CheR [Saccharobesus litoralis]